MVSSKKSSKSLIALVVMAILLVASIVLAATGAWFTSAVITDNDGALTFGTVELAESTEIAISADHALVVPGCTITVAGELDYTGTADAYVGYKVSIVFDKVVDIDENDLADGYELSADGKTISIDTVVEATSTTANISLAQTINIPKTLGNDAQGATATMTVNAVAIQKDHLDSVPASYQDIIDMM